MSPLRLNGSTSGYSQLDAPAIAGDQTFTLPGTGGTLDRLNRAGNILQVVNATYGTAATSSSSTFADTGLTASITPSSSSSKILVLINHSGCYKSTNDTYMGIRLLRGSTVIHTFETVAAYTASSANNAIGSCSTVYLDSPASTGSVSYKTQLASQSNVGIVGVQFNSSSISTITLLEVAA